METPSLELQNSLAKIGVFVTDTPNRVAEGEIGVIVELPVSSQFKESDLPKFGIKTVSRRGMIFYFDNWFLSSRGGVSILGFYATTALPKDISPEQFQDGYATTFMDLCWNTGTEILSSVQDPALPFHLPEEVTYSDLGWHMPARVLDHLIDALGKVNEVFLDGACEDAMLYGTICL